MLDLCERGKDMSSKAKKNKKKGETEETEKELSPVNKRTEVVVELEELESRLEMQNAPVSAMDECPLHVDGCYSDGCEGEFCNQCMENSCPGHCYCQGEWCTEECIPECLAYCMLCTNDTVAVVVDSW